MTRIYVNGHDAAEYIESLAFALPFAEDGSFAQALGLKWYIGRDIPRGDFRIER